MSEFNDVKVWMDRCDQTNANTEMRSLYVALVFEEVAELAETISKANPNKSTSLEELVNHLKSLSLIFKTTPVFHEAIANVSRSDLADDLNDIKWVCNGLQRAYQIDGTIAWNALCASNYSKLDPDTGRAQRDENGKVIKPKTFFKPDFTNALM